MTLVSPLPERRYSRDEFRRWYDAQPNGRFERVDGVIVAMAPERIVHVRIKGAVYRALYRAVTEAGADCEALTDGATIETGDSDYEPDVLVHCGALPDGEAIAAPNPVIVVEVLSPGTGSTDTGAKLADYFLVPSIMHYLIVHPIRRRIIHHRRVDGGIETRLVVGGEIVMDPPGIAITIDEIYGHPPVDTIS